MRGGRGPRRREATPTNPGLPIPQEPALLIEPSKFVTSVPEPPEDGTNFARPPGLRKGHMSMQKLWQNIT